MRFFVVWLAVAAYCGAQETAPLDAREILKRSIPAAGTNWRIAQTYTFMEREQKRDLDGSGRVKATHTEVSEVFFLGGKIHRRLVEKDGRPLSPKDAKREQEKLDRAAEDASKLTEADRAKRDAKKEREIAEDRDQLKHIPDAFHFTVIGETTLGGREVYEIEARPRADYKGKHDNLYRKLQGKLWIDTRDYQWVRVEAEALDTISIGWLFARIGKGARISFEQTWINNEVWLPKSLAVRAGGRLALVKKVNIDLETLFSDYRKFQSDSRITDVAEVGPSAP